MQSRKKDEITLLQRILKFPLTINRISNISIVFAQFHLKKNRIRYSFSYTFTSAAKNQQPFTTTACSGKDHTHHKRSCIRHTLAPEQSVLAWHGPRIRVAKYLYMTNAQRHCKQRWHCLCFCPKRDGRRRKVEILM